jgi:hypothetical protein
MGDRLRVELQRETHALREILQGHIDGQSKLITLLEQRIDREIERAEITRKESHTELQMRLTALADGVQQQFGERDIRAEQAIVSARLAVDAALQAQKEAAGAQNESNNAAAAKSEALFMKQIDSLGALFAKQVDGLYTLLSSNTAGLNDKIDDLKGRLDRGDGTVQGVSSNRGEQRQDTNLIMVFVSAGIALVSFIYAMLQHGKP